MATNPITGIDYDIDRFAIRLVSTGQVLSFSVLWPRPDGGPIEGGNPDRAYYRRMNEDPPPIDHRYWLETVQEFVDASPPAPEGHPVGEYRITHTPQLLPAEDLKRQVDDQFQVMVRQYFPASADPALALEITGALQAVSENRALTAAQQDALTANTLIADGIGQNRVRVAELYAAIDAGQEYDITQGWIAPAVP